MAAKTKTWLRDEVLDLLSDAICESWGPLESAKPLGPHAIEVRTETVTFIVTVSIPRGSGE